jgi:hypothetical protein
VRWRWDSKGWSIGWFFGVLHSGLEYSRCREGDLIVEFEIKVKVAE